ncbi:MAG: sugar-phosphatase, partial [Myxococcota bacterium]|nr:sugar-phosphatase [Myxococcota bacterium]
MTPIAIFDRDGTIIDVVRDQETGVITVAFHPDQLRFLPDAIDGMRMMQDAGFALAIATNQP